MYKPRTQQTFWCSRCDRQRVDSENAATGGFFLQAGHAFNEATQEYDGEYVQVMYALCAECLKEE